jgi:UDP-glucuronate decarboxylase
VRVLVTGASGFVGSHVVKTLIDQGHDVTALARPESSLWRLDDVAGRFRVVRSDSTAPASLLAPLEGWRPEACVHLAWYAVPGEYLQSPENVTSLTLSLRMLDELVVAGCEHVVMTGTCYEYDTEAGVLREDGPMRPVTIYAASKLAAKMIGELRAAQLGVGFTWARLFYLYGPFEDDRRLVPAVIRAMLEGREFPATTGTQVRDYLHVEDVAGALCALATQRVAGTYNVCSGKQVTVAELIGEVARITGHPDLVRLGALPQRAGDPMFISGDNTRLRAATSWKPQHSLTEGLSGTVAWWKQFLGRSAQAVT